MLVLSRKPNEYLYIGHDVIVQIVGVHGNRVRIGIDAPSNVPVHRAEIYGRSTDIDLTICPCCGAKRQEVDTDAI